MTKKRKQFSPHIYQEWGELFDNISVEERSEILLGITKFPEYEPKNVPIWSFIKSQLCKDYEIFAEKCKMNSSIIQNYWNKKKKGIRMYTNEYECIPKLITNNELQITNNKNKYGEFNNVKLTETEYTKLKDIYKDNLNEAIEILSSYLASKGDKYKSHYAVLGKHNWVYKKINENKKESITQTQEMYEYV